MRPDTITFLSPPVEFESSEPWFKRPFTPLRVSAIVNPMGPTLMVVLVSGRPSPGITLPVVEVYLNPFSVMETHVGNLLTTGPIDVRALLPRIHELPRSSRPSLVLPSSSLTAAERVSLFAVWLRGFPDARELLEGLRRHPGDSETRVANEMKRAWGPPPADEPPPAAEASRELLASSEAEELATTMFSREHMVSEWKAFLAAWGASTRQVGLPPAMAKGAMSQRAIEAILKLLMPFCYPFAKS